MFLPPWSFVTLPIHKHCVSSCPTQHAVSTAQLMTHVMCDRPIPLAARSKAWVCDCSLAGIVVSNPTGDIGVVGVMCCQVEVCASV